jgi:hypothetical protein
LEVLKSRLNEPSFAGLRVQIIDDADGSVKYGPVTFERSAALSVEDIAQSMGVPIVDRRSVGLTDEALANLPKRKVGYTLEAFHSGGIWPVVSLSLKECEAHEIVRELWRHVDFWAAPGGGTIQIRAAEEAETINRILGDRRIVFDPERHRWLFHVHLV